MAVHPLRCPRIRLRRVRRVVEVSEPSDHVDRAVGCRWGHRRDRARVRKRDRAGSREAGQRGQSHRRERRGRAPGDRSGGAGRLHDRHHHRRDRDDAPPGTHRSDGRLLHAAWLDQLRCGRRAGARGRAVPDARRPGAGDQGESGEAQGVGYRAGGHLARRDCGAARRSEDSADVAETPGRRSSSKTRRTSTPCSSCSSL